MRLVCPNCGAQYEVPDDVIPQGGRDVQCSNCGDTWFQNHPDNDHGLAEDLGEALTQEVDASEAEQPEADEEPMVQTPPAAPEGRKRELDPSVADVLREEAAREAAARKREASSALEEQPDLGIGEPDDEAARRQREASERMSRMRGEDPKPAKVAAATAASGSRRDVLPDIDEINSTLRKDSERRKTASEVAASREAAPKQSGFLRGFLLVMALAAVLIGIYIFSPQISEAVPALAPALESYTGFVDTGRLWLDGQVRGLMGTLDGMATETAPTEAVSE